MAEHGVYDTETSELVGKLDIPDDILEAAVKVARWLEKRPPTFELYGLVLTENAETLPAPAAQAGE